VKNDADEAMLDW